MRASPRRFSAMTVWLLALAMGLALLLHMPDALAATTPSSTGTSTTAAAGCSAYVGVTNKIAGCIRDTISTVAAKYFKDFYPLVAHAIGAFITLGVVIYGVMLASGQVEKLGRDTMMLLIKLTLVGFFSQNADIMYKYATDGMDAAGAVVVKASPRNGLADGNTDYSNVTCLTNLVNASEEAGKPVVGPWLGMDCLLDTVIGIKPTTVSSGSGKTYNEKITLSGLKRGMIYFFFSGMQTSVVGVILAIVGFVFMWGLIAMIIKSLMTYIAAYIGLCFMMIISPLFIPLVLFRHTKEYFDKWVKLTLSFALQPVLILLFISLSVAAVDLAMFSGDYSVMYRVAGDASRVNGFNLNTYLTSNNIIAQKPAVAMFVKTDDCKQDLAAGDMNSALPGLARVVEKTGGAKTNCQVGMPLQAMRDTIDWDKLASLRKPAVVMDKDSTTAGQQIMREVLSAAIFCGVVIFVMNKMMAVVPHILVDLIGDIGQTPNLFRSTTDGWNRGAQQLSGQISGGLSSTISESIKKMTTQRGGG